MKTLRFYGTTYSDEALIQNGIIEPLGGVQGTFEGAQVVPEGQKTILTCLFLIEIGKAPSLKMQGEAGGQLFKYGVGPV